MKAIAFQEAPRISGDNRFIIELNAEEANRLLTHEARSKMSAKLASPGEEFSLAEIFDKMNTNARKAQALDNMMDAFCSCAELAETSALRKLIALFSNAGILKKEQA